MESENKPYNPAEIEKEIYQIWEKSGYFNPDNLKLKKGAKPFCIIMPPPNANEALHLGHALTITIEDILIRFNRMRGKKTLWLPGSDHAGFETQVVFEKKLEKEGKNRFDFDRDTLYKIIWDYVQNNKHMMESQTRALGASCDWSREKFTLDPKIIEIVYATFKKLYDDGLVYRGKRVINWCPKHQTSFSELEVKYEEREDKLWYIKYPIVNIANGTNLDTNNTNPPQPSLKGGSDSPPLGGVREDFEPKYIIVATTRPETMLGDTAVAVNPKDKRYKNLIGQKVKLPLTNREIAIIADSAVEIDFGTGAVKVTPAHDQTDFEIAERHNLEILEVISKNGKMTDIVPEPYRGLKTNEAREKIVADLNAQGLIEKEEPYKHTVGSCYKCGRTIEPLVSEQWFIKIRPLADKAIAAVKKGQTKFVSKKYEKIFMHWMKNIHDWNISRQIVWGIRIPAWYCQECKNITVTDGKTPTKCEKCDSQKLKQEEDVFDTWFSSGQWPFATLIASQPDDFENFYPTTVMETGWDILFFWVARMMMMGIYCTRKVPFKYVYLHGMIRDKDKQKMSKSKDNAINPIGVLEERGADALRMSLVFGAGTDSDLPFSEEKVIAQQRFANKIWNASKFVLSAIDDMDSPLLEKEGLGEILHPEDTDKKFTKEDKWILKELQTATKKITKDIEKFKFHEAAQGAYHFFWHSFCDKTIEDVKIRIANGSKDAEAGKLVLWTVLYNSLKLLHPFMPFVTEAIYQKLPSRPKEMLMIEEWPE
ncbi:MAG: valine--tRNA ligase [Candidatus Portnoybacteria bacterium RBG_13_41_18]|uniref:Valine--tRNA ligase n=1 Tax=Candidatus Portnoybacteria bacterium RBG_13_41_18 TaxID=1801991 RepID=A0A1G2F8R9_9BACT|nr:MAG: valine--tRNA ligase [Candidatus Portnoybacteria bacterium RBG_13_41_18]